MFVDPSSQNGLHLSASLSREPLKHELRGSIPSPYLILFWAGSPAPSSGGGASRRARITENISCMCVHYKSGVWSGSHSQRSKNRVPRPPVPLVFVLVQANVSRYMIT